MPFTRREFLKSVPGGLAWLGIAGMADAATTTNRRPNILLVISDDQGFGDLRAHGNPLIDTPVQDGLAAAGARFDRFFVCPVCAPTRGGLLTGRYHPRMGVCGTSSGWERMRTQEFTLAEALRDAGYATGAFGKWHNGHYYPEHPNGQGFDTFVGFCMGHWNGYFDPVLQRNGETFKSEGYITDILTDHALEFIGQHRHDPFLCYVAYNVPHTPFMVPDPYFDKYKARGLDDAIASVYGMTECMDFNLGRLLAKLDELSLADDTIVLFMSDNGPARGGDDSRYNAGMRGAKGSVHEGGVRVPFFVRWQGKIQPGTLVKPIACYVDVMPTLLDLAGTPATAGVAFDGISLAPLVTRQDASLWPDRKLFSIQSRGPGQPLLAGAVRTQRWLAVTESRGDAGWQLYDMPVDPGEERDVADAHPEVLAELRTAFEDWYADVMRDGLETGPVPVGYPGWPIVDVLPQDAEFHGDLGEYRLNNAYVTGWHDTESYVEWTLDLITAGLYEIGLFYTCPEANTGTRMRVSIGDQHVEGPITEAYDPEMLPSPQRVVSQHYIEKTFTPMTLGTLRLDRGLTQMTVHASKIVGDRAIDLKCVRIKRLG